MEIFDSLSLSLLPPLSLLHHYHYFHYFLSCYHLPFPVTFEILGRQIPLLASRCVRVFLHFSFWKPKQNKYFVLFRLVAKERRMCFFPDSEKTSDGSLGWPTSIRDPIVHMDRSSATQFIHPRTQFWVLCNFSLSLLVPSQRRKKNSKEKFFPNIMCDVYLAHLVKVEKHAPITSHHAHRLLDSLFDQNK